MDYDHIEKDNESLINDSMEDLDGAVLNCTILLTYITIISIANSIFQTKIQSLRISRK